MKKLDAQELQGFKWVKAGFWKSDYELHDQAGEVIARMVRPHWWNYYVEIDAPGNRWSFERKGFFRQHIVIKTIGTQEESARFNYQFSNGRLEFPDGRVYTWKQANFWGTKWAWSLEDGTPVLGFKSGGMLQVNAELDPYPAANLMNSPLALLVYLGWYLLMLHYEDASAAATVVVTTAG